MVTISFLRQKNCDKKNAGGKKLLHKNWGKNGAKENQ